VAKATITAFLTCLALAACGGEGNGDGRPSGEADTEAEARAERDKTFADDGYSFSYPANWEEHNPAVRFEGGATPTSETYIGLSNTDLLGVLANKGPVSITDSNLDSYIPDLATLAFEIFTANGGDLLRGPERVTVGGLPGLRSIGWLLNIDDVRVESRFTWLFDRTTQYSMNCQYTPAHAEEMKRGCDQVERTFQVTR
jgi:hypothetical protein